MRKKSRGFAAMAAVVCMAMMVGCGSGGSAATTAAAAPAASAAADKPAETAAAPAAAGGTRYISIATSSSGGAFSIIGTAMADIINKNMPEMSANIEITGGSSENILLCENKNVELAMSASDVLALALEGKGSFEGKQVSKDSLKGIMGGHLTTLQVYTLKEGNIKTYADLKGRKIAVGPSGSVAGDAMKAIMDASLC